MLAPPPPEEQEKQRRRGAGNRTERGRKNAGELRKTNDAVPTTLAAGRHASHLYKVAEKFTPET